MSSIPVRASDGVEPPPESFNFAGYLLAQNIHRPGKPAFIDDRRTLSYGVLDERVRRMASGLRDLGIKREERVLLLMQDTNDWPVAFLGAIYAGIVPVPVNTLLTADDYAYMLEHSRAQAALVSGAVLPTLKAALTPSDHEVHRVIVSHPVAPLDFGEVAFEAFLDGHAPRPHPAPTHADHPAFWLYSSGSTGRPKGAVHSHANPYWTAEHIFMSNRPGQVRYGTTGWPVPGYEIELRSDGGHAVPDGEPGDLYIHGPSAAMMYWGNRARTRETFQGGWTRSGDEYIRNPDGTYTYAGRSDDMLKVSGIWVSPFEVEATLVQHPSVLEAAVIGVPDAEGLVKTKAFVVLKAGEHATDADLKAFVKDRLAPYKYPRAIVFADELPKTATGKIQRFKLRAQAASDAHDEASAGSREDGVLMPVAL
jgi:acyl-coenzyme A synthetase/AMP-(fatty) acid ligase